MSELKRVAFATHIHSTNNSCVGAGGVSSSSIVADGVPSISKKAMPPPPPPPLLPSSASSSAASSGTGAGLSSSSSSSTSLVTASSSGVAVPSDIVTSRQQNSKTIRLELQLFEPNSNSSPEFNYLELTKIEKKKLKKLSRINGFSDPFEDNDDDVARIAKELEKKYGSGVVGCGKRRSKKDDLTDKGAGYDESDSFIDNTEAYDEIIPDEVETVEGGFYINSGALEFKRLSNYERPTEDVVKINKTKKRTLSTSSSSSDEGDESNEAEEETEGNSSPRENLITNTALKIKNGHVDKKQKNSGSDGVSDKEMNVKSSSSSSSISTKHKEKRSENTRPKLKDDVKVEEMDVDPVKEKDKEKTVKTTTIKDMLKAKRDNFRKMQEVSDAGKVKLINGESSVKGGSASNDSSETSADDSDSDDDDDDGPSEKRFKKNGDDDTEKMRVSDVKLPDTLNEEILKDIQEMKEIGKMQIQYSKNFQFDEKITEIFLRIDDACICLDKSLRNSIFAHIEYHLSLSKYCLLRKAKQLRIKEEKTKTKKAFTKLKKAVHEVMPSILLQYEANCKKIDEIRSTITPTELEKMDHPPKYPKKKFPWNENFRNLLYELYQVRWMSYTVLKTRKELFEDFVNNYLKEKVVSIWPAGWMKYEDLKKELERRKLSAKKIKDKKSVFVDLTSERKSDNHQSPTDLASNSKSSYPLDSVKSALSSSSSLSVVSTKDLVVTIASTKNNSEKLTSSEVPNLGAQSNSLSITQVSVNSNNSQSKGQMNSGTGKSSQHDGLNFPSHHKSSTKSNSGSSNTSSGASKSPSPSHLEHSHTSVSSSSVSSKTVIGQNVTNFSSSNNHTHTKSSSKLSSNNSNNNNNNSVNSHHQKLANVTIATNATTTTSKASTDLMSPSKRATDHSISSIMSSSACPSIAALNTDKNSPPSSSSNETATTHVITVDNLKCTTEIIKTTNQLLNSGNATNNNTNTSGSTLSAKEGSIRIRSFANVNSSLENLDLIKESNNGGFLKPEIKTPQEQDSSSESDGLEIVGVYPVAASKKQSIPVNKSSSSKHKKSKASSRSESPIGIAAFPAIQSLTKAAKLQGTGGEIKETDLDVNQIMKALKELEKLQYPTNSAEITNLSDSSSSSPVDRSSVNTTNNSMSPIYYKDEKDIKSLKKQ